MAFIKFSCIVEAAAIMVTHVISVAQNCHENPRENKLSHLITNPQCHIGIPQLLSPPTVVGTGCRHWLQQWSNNGVKEAQNFTFADKKSSAKIHK